MGDIPRARLSPIDVCETSRELGAFPWPTLHAWGWVHSAGQHCMHKIGWNQQWRSGASSVACADSLSG